MTLMILAENIVQAEAKCALITLKYVNTFYVMDHTHCLWNSHHSPSTEQNLFIFLGKVHGIPPTGALFNMAFYCNFI